MNAVRIQPGPTDRFSRFVRSEDGAVTGDWVVMVAGVVGLGVATTLAVRTGAGALGQDVSVSLSAASVADLGCLGGTGSDQWACYSGPTISAALWAWGYVSTPMCMAGAVSCPGEESVFNEAYEMSTGEIYNRESRTQDGVTTITWTNGRGQVVESPPPMIR